VQLLRSANLECCCSRIEQKKYNFDKIRQII
jgi:hypothetical protein